MKHLTDVGAGDEESHDEHDEDEDPAQVPTSKLEAWESRKKKYQGYADKGKVHKLEKARDKQLAKAKKAEETKKEKPYYEAYVKYKGGPPPPDPAPPRPSPPARFLTAHPVALRICTRGVF